MLLLGALAALMLQDGPAWDRVVRIAEEGVTRRLYPGAVVVVGRRDSVEFARGFGRLSWDPNARRPDPTSTRFDLASLTKVVATTSAMAALVRSGQVDLDVAVGRYLPRFQGQWKGRVTVRMLLNHTSGLPAFAPLYRHGANKTDAIGALFAVPLDALPGERVRYSDLNAILLGLLVEAISGLPLDRYVEASVFRPLGMRHTGFAPSDHVDVAPSLVLLGHPAPGTASDPNARALGGVAGHAGLFGSGLDLATFARAWLGGPPVPWLEGGLRSQFLQPAGRTGTRVLGWDTPDPDRLPESPFGVDATPTTYGHTGWTGTLLWFDPQRDLFLVFLTNRSLGPSTAATMSAMRKIRTRLSDAVAGAAATAPR